MLAVGATGAAGEVVSVLAGAGLLLWWAVATRDHARRRRAQTAEWSDAARRPDLWTSGARCPHCEASGGLIEVSGDELVFTCLACARTHTRETKG